jgi:anti-anti-sigma factor
MVYPRPDSLVGMRDDRQRRAPTPTGYCSGAARPERVIVDLVDVPLVDAAGVAALLDAASAARLADVGLRLTGARPYVFHVLKVSGLAELLFG